MDVFSYYRFQYFVSLSDVSCQDWPSHDLMEHILFKGSNIFTSNYFFLFPFTLFGADHTLNYYITAEDIADLSRLRAKLQMPESPPDPATISPEILALHKTIASRYVGAASLISLKTPQEGFQKHQALLKDVRKGYTAQLEKAYRLSTDQQVVYHSGVGSYVNFGGHGSGGETIDEVMVITLVQASPS